MNSESHLGIPRCRDSAQFGNSVARYIIESGYGYPTHSVYGASVPLVRNLVIGEVHVYMEGWLPNLQDLYEEALAAPTDGKRIFGTVHERD